MNRALLCARRFSVLLGTGLALVSCADGDPLMPHLESGDALRSNLTAAQQFTFLSPLAHPSQVSGDFDASLPVTVTVCETSEFPCPAERAVASFATTATDPRAAVHVDEEGPAYLAVWTAERQRAPSVRIQVSIGDVQIGHADVWVLESASQARNLPAGAFYVLHRQALPIRFHIARGLMAAAPLGSEGGEVATDDGAVTLTVPAGALQEDAVLTIQQQATADPSVLPGTLYRFGPSGTQFLVPVRITIGYDPASLPAGSSASALWLYHLASDGIWVPVAGSTVDTASGTVSGDVSHFSLFAVRMGPCAASSPFTVGTTIEGELGPDDCPGDSNTMFDYFTLDLAEPTTLYFEARSPDFLPNVRLFDLNDRVVANAYPLGADGIFTRAVIPAGSYRFWVGNTRSPGQLGSYTLTVRHDVPWSEPCARRANAFAAPGGSVANAFRAHDCNDPVGDPNNKVHRYFLHATEGRTYRATITANGVMLASVWRGTVMAEHRQLPGAGSMTITHTAQANGYIEFALLGVEGREYHIAFDEVASEPCTAYDRYPVGTYLSGELTASDCLNVQNDRRADFYHLTLDEPTSASFQLSSTAFSPFVAILRDGVPVVTQFGGTGFTRAILAPGSYQLRASSIEGGVTGPYTLSSSPDPNNELGCASAASSRVFVTSGVTTQGQIRAGDCYDQYAHDLGHTGWYLNTFVMMLTAETTLTLTLTANTEARVSLWGSTGGPIEFQMVEDLTSAGTTTLTWRAPVTGWAYVYSIGRIGTSYTLSFDSR
jgi:hypothetical protein